MATYLPSTGTKPQWRESDAFPAIIVDNRDPNSSGRYQIQYMEISGVAPNQLPWVGYRQMHSQVTQGGMGGGGGGGSQGHATKETSPMNIGDIVWIKGQGTSAGNMQIVSAADTIQQNDGGSQSTGPGNFQTTGLHTGQSTPLQTTTYPAAGSPTIFSPPQRQYKMADSQDPRQFAMKRMQQAFPDFGPKASQMFQNGQSIIKQTMAGGSPVTQVIQQLQRFTNEAQGSNQVPQMLNKLRQQLNTQDMQGFPGQAAQGALNGINSLFGGQLMGALQQIMSMAQSMASQQNQSASQNQTLSNAVSDNAYVLPANIQPLNNTPASDPTQDSTNTTTPTTTATA